MKGHHIAYTTAELAWFKHRRKMPRRELHAAFQREFTRPMSLDNLKALMTRKGWRTGRDGCYAKGSVPANKGKPHPSNANAARHHFKKGQLPHNTKFEGHERVSKDGYVEISIAETNPHTGYERRYVLKHRHLWEKVNGPIPKGHCLKCLDGDATNCQPANWVAIPRQLLPRLAGRWGMNYDTAPAPLKPVLLAIAKLEQGARVMRNANKEEAAP